MFSHEKKMVQFYRPQVWGGNESLVIGNNRMYIKMSIISLVMECKGHVK